jgi:hypothetical protein
LDIKVPWPHHRLGQRGISCPTRYDYPHRQASLIFALPSSNERLMASRASAGKVPLPYHHACAFLLARTTQRTRYTQFMPGRPRLTDAPTSARPPLMANRPQPIRRPLHIQAHRELTASARATPRRQMHGWLGQEHLLDRRKIHRPNMTPFPTAWRFFGWINLSRPLHYTRLCKPLILGYWQSVP